MASATLSRAGISRVPSIISRHRRPGMQTVRPFSSALNDSSTTRSGLSHSSFGVRDSASLPDRAWNSVCVSPGHNACTFTPYGAASSAAALLSESTNALVAAYVPRGTQAATDETLMIDPGLGRPWRPARYGSAPSPHAR